MANKYLLPVFWAMVAASAIVFAVMLAPVSDHPRSSLFFITPGAVFFVLGLVLLLMVIRTKIDRRLKWFLLLASASTVGILVSVILHNLVTALFWDFWQRTGLEDEPVFFTLAVVICPLAYLTGLIGTFVLLARGHGKPDQAVDP